MTPLECDRQMWDYPNVKLVADNRGRLTSSDLFQPGAAFDASPQPDGSIRVIRLEEREVPTVRPRRVNGRLRGADVKISRQVIAAAIRAGRDER
ncbi:MAG: hypothetical protein KGR98_05150 [Verrucomicrobia bacterium]|nr:hypothetical protein [Verrucomicrobiota bacterium]MDE3098604.1 hypothetical protein [Verrucomicrobiota bacterium]